MILPYLNFSPDISPDAWVAPSADIIGRVHIGAGSSIWYQSVLRGDVNRIDIGTQTNIQDGTVIHNSDDAPCIIGSGG